jgi:hypothetical protein
MTLFRFDLIELCRSQQPDQPVPFAIGPALAADASSDNAWQAQERALAEDV